MIRKGVVLYSPILILTGIWLLILSLYLINPFNLNEIRIYTWFVLGSGLFFIYIGFFTAKLLASGFDLNNFVSIRYEFPFDTQKLNNLVVILLLISSIGVILKLYIFLQQIPDKNMFLFNSGEVRHIFIDVESGKGVNVLLYKLLSHMASLGGMTVILAGSISNIRKYRLISILPLLVSAIYSIGTLQRVYFIKHYILWLASSFLFLYYFPVYLQKDAVKSFLKKIVVFVFIAFFFLLFVIIVRSLFDLGVTSDKIINSFYFYTAGNVYLLDAYLMNEPDLLCGASILRSFVGWFVGFGLLDKSAIIYPHYEFFRIYNTFGNTFSYIRVPYEDFGILGVLILSYSWGWVSYIVIRSFLKKFTFMNLGISSMMLLSFFWSFYGFAWIHFTALILMFFQLWIVDYFYLIEK